MNTTASKKDFFYIVVLVLTFITVIIGATFALYASLKKFDDGSSRVYTGTLKIDYVSGDIINCNLIKPMNKLDRSDEVNVYKNEFKVTNDSTLDSLLKVVLEIKINEFSDKTLMYSLYVDDDDKAVAEGYLEGDGEIEIAQNIELEHDVEEKQFYLYIWIEDNGENQNEEMKKNLIGQIKVVADQKIG